MPTRKPNNPDEPRETGGGWIAKTAIRAGCGVALLLIFFYWLIWFMWRGG